MKVALPDGPLANSASASLPQRLPELFSTLAPWSSSAQPAAKLSASALNERYSQLLQLTFQSPCASATSVSPHDGQIA